MKQRIARTIICMLTIYLVLMMALEIRRNRELIQASNVQNAKRYEKMSKQMADMFDEMQKNIDKKADKFAPCDIETKRNSKYDYHNKETER